MDYYKLDKILKKHADYNIIFGERSNGKTYAVLEYALKEYVKHGSQLAIVRRWREDLRGKRAESMFNAHVANGLISELSNGKYNEVFYMSNKWFLSYYDSEKEKRYPDNKPFAYGFALSEVEHDKSTSYPDVRNILFDEFLTRRYYLPDEFIIFMNVLSTIIRLRDDVKIFMLGNTVNKYCPYFAEMGLKHISEMEQGTIDVYKYGDSNLTVAVEYTASMQSQKASNKYFCFDNENLQMITGGKWELAIYPHLTIKYQPKDIVFTYFIEFQENILQCEIIQKDDSIFTYVHEKTTPIKNPDTDLIYSLEPNEKPNYKRRLLSTASQLEKKIAMFYALEKVFFQSNEVGEIVRNYIMCSSKSNFART